MIRTTRQKINKKNIEDVNNPGSQLDIADVYTALHQVTAECMLVLVSFLLL
jgi:hypothetical protein